MKKLKAVFIICLILISIGLLSWDDYVKTPPAYAKPSLYPITMCGTSLEAWSDTTAGRAKILAGLGDLHYRVTTSSPKAKEFFDQGLRLVYGVLRRLMAPT